jgi:fibronectin type 3 domain-containing protein
MRSWPLPDGTIKLSWSASPGASGYTVYRNSSLSPTIGFVPLTTLPIPKTNYSDRDKNLVEGFNYDYRVTAINSSGTSSPSEIKSAVSYASVTSTELGIALVSSIAIVLLVIIGTYALASIFKQIK